MPRSSVGKESACNAGDLSLIPGKERFPGEGQGYSLQHSGLENSMDCIVHGVPKSWTWLSHFHFHYVPSLQAGCLWKPEGGMNHQKDSAALPAERTTLGQEKRKATVPSYMQKGKSKMLLYLTKWLLSIIFNNLHQFSGILSTFENFQIDSGLWYPCSLGNPFFYSHKNENSFLWLRPCEAFPTHTLSTSNLSVRAMYGKTWTSIATPSTNGCVWGDWSLAMERCYQLHPTKPFAWTHTSSSLVRR